MATIIVRYPPRPQDRPSDHDLWEVLLDLRNVEQVDRLRDGQVPVFVGSPIVGLISEIELELAQRQVEAGIRELVMAGASHGR